jgi:hypothetical protein
MPGRKAATLTEEATEANQNLDSEMSGHKATTSADEAIGTSQTAEGEALVGTAATYDAGRNGPDGGGRCTATSYAAGAQRAAVAALAQRTDRSGCAAL